MRGVVLCVIVKDDVYLACLRRELLRAGRDLLDFFVAVIVVETRSDSLAGSVGMRVATMQTQVRDSGVGDFFDLQA